MAVEAHHLNPLFSSNREMVHPVEANGLAYNTQFRYGTVPSATATFNPTVECQTSLMNPINNIATDDCLFHPSMKPAIKSVDSSVTFNSDNNVDFFRPVSSSSLRKRSREESVVVNPKHCTDPLLFLGQDLSSNVQTHNFDCDRLISNHVERMRMEIEERRKTQGRRLMQAVEQGFMKTLRAKDEEINHIGKLNLFLEEKVKSLCVENQIWRDVAQSNEATVNALRSNLQQVLAAVERNRWEEPTVADDAQSCCGSSDEGDSDEKRWRLAGEAHGKKKMRRITKTMCRNCGNGEASVLLLPCRHICLCSACGSLLNTCPICKSPKNASLHVNLSS